MYPQASFPTAPASIPGLSAPAPANQQASFQMPPGGNSFAPPADSFQSHGAPGMGQPGGGQPSDAEINQMLAQLMSSMGGGQPGAMGAVPGAPGGASGISAGNMRQDASGAVYEDNGKASGGGIMSLVGNLLKPRNLLIAGGALLLAIVAGPRVIKKFFGEKNPVQVLKSTLTQLSETPEGIAKNLTNADEYLGRVNASIGKPEALEELRTGTRAGIDRLKTSAESELGIKDVAAHLDEASPGFDKLLDEAGKLTEGQTLADEIVSDFRAVVDKLAKVLNPSP